MDVAAVETPPDRRRLGGRAAGAVVDQFVVAGTSFVLMILVRKQLGAAALGEYAVLINAMILVTSVQTAWVGDSLTVMDRRDPDVRGALVGSHLGFVVAAVAVGSVLVAGVTDRKSALLFGGMVALWITEEVGRRIFMACQEFWALVLNDVVYAAGAFVAAAVLRLVLGRYSVTMIVAAMAIGAGMSILAAGMQLPRAEIRLARPRLEPVQAMARFAGWRSAQMAIRPLALFAVRSLVIAIAGRAALGDLEGARLFSQPAMTYVSGVASLLLPLYAEDERRKARSARVSVTTALLVAPVALYAAAVILLESAIAPVLLGPGARVSGTAVVGWLAIAVMFAAGQPVANLLIARKRSREIFWVRAADSAIGLMVAFPLVWLVSPDLAPWSLAGGMIVGTFWLAWLAHRPDPHAPREPAGGALAEAVGS